MKRTKQTPGDPASTRRWRGHVESRHYCSKCGELAFAPVEVGTFVFCAKCAPTAETLRNALSDSMKTF